MRTLFIVAVALAACKQDTNAAKPAADAAPTVKVAPRALDAAPAPVAKVAPTPDAGDDGPGAIPAEWWTTGCPKVLLAISRCASDPGFVDALTAGTSKADHKLMLGRIADLKGMEQPDEGAPKTDRAHEECGELPSVAFSDPGFLDGDWRALGAPDLLADCAKLGVAIKDAGGLFGGTVDE